MKLNAAILVLLLSVLGVNSWVEIRYNDSSSNCSKLTQPWQYTQLAKCIDIWVAGVQKGRLSSAPALTSTALLKFMNEARDCVFLAGSDVVNQATATDTVNARLFLFFVEETLIDTTHPWFTLGPWHPDGLALMKSLANLLEENVAALISAGRATFGISAQRNAPMNLDEQCASNEWSRLNKCENAFRLIPEWRRATCEQAEYFFHAIRGYMTRTDLALWACRGQGPAKGTVLGVLSDIIMHGKKAAKTVVEHMAEEGCNQTTVGYFTRLFDGLTDQPGSAAFAMLMVANPKAMTAKEKRPNWGQPAVQEIRVDPTPCNDGSHEADVGRMDELRLTTSCVAGMRRGEKLSCNCKKLIAKNNADWWPIDENGNLVDYSSVLEEVSEPVFLPAPE